MTAASVMEDVTMDPDVRDGRIDASMDGIDYSVPTNTNPGRAKKIVLISIAGMILVGTGVAIGVVLSGRDGSSSESLEQPQAYSSGSDGTDEPVATIPSNFFKNPMPGTDVSTRLAACKANAAGANKIVDEQLCEDFYGPGPKAPGIAISMIATEVFQDGPNSTHVTDFASNDGTFFHLDPTRAVDGDTVQALSIINYEKVTKPFEGYCDVGVAMRLSTNFGEDFWRYTLDCPSGYSNWVYNWGSNPSLPGVNIQASCGDGSGCASCKSTENGRCTFDTCKPQECPSQGTCEVENCEIARCIPEHLGATCSPQWSSVADTSPGMSYDSWSSAINLVLDKTGQCGSYPTIGYNEINTNGLDPKAFAGIFWFYHGGAYNTKICSTFSEELEPEGCKTLAENLRSIGPGSDLSCGRLDKASVCGYIRRFQAAWAAGDAAPVPVYKYSLFDDGTTDLAIEFYLDPSECA